MSNRRIITLALSSLAALAAGRAVADPTIVNGSFEDPAFAAGSITDITNTGVTGWTGSSFNREYVINGNVEDTYERLIGTTPFGDQYLGLNAIRNNSFRAIESQVVSGFAVGQDYALTLYWANLDGAGDAKLSVVASDGGEGTGDVLAEGLFTLPAEGPYGEGVIDFRPVTITFTALTDTVTFSIGNQSRTGIEGVDNVSLAALAGAVPEPTSWATMMAGFGLVGSTLRRRTRKVAIA